MQLYSEDLRAPSQASEGPDFPIGRTDNLQMSRLGQRTTSVCLQIQSAGGRPAAEAFQLSRLDTDFVGRFQSSIACANCDPLADVLARGAAQCCWK